MKQNNFLYKSRKFINILTLQRIVLVLVFVIAQAMPFTKNQVHAQLDIKEIKTHIDRLKSHLVFEHAICEFEVRYGFNSSLEEAKKNGPALGIRTGKYKWVFDETREFIYPEEIDEISGNNDLQYGKGTILQHEIYLTDNSFILVINPNITQGTITPKDSLKYLTAYYNRNESFFITLISSFKTESKLSHFFENFDDEMSKDGIANTTTSTSLTGGIIAFNAKGDKDGEQNYNIQICFSSSSFFPLSSTTTINDDTTYVSVLDFFKCSNNRFFPKKLLVVDSFERSDERMRYRTFEYTVKKFEPDIHPSEHEFEFAVPDGVGISNGEKSFEYIYPEYWNDLKVIGPSKLAGLYQLIQSETQKRNKAAQEKPIESYFGARLLIFVIGLLFLLTGITGPAVAKWIRNRRARNNEV